MVHLAGLSRRWRAMALSLLLLGAAVLLLFHVDEPLRRWYSGVKPGVQLQGQSMERMLRPEVAAVVEGIARAEGRKPVDAVRNREFATSWVLLGVLSPRGVRGWWRGTRRGHPRTDSSVPPREVVARP